MRNKSALEILKSLNAIITNDHFVYTSGKHGSMYIRKDILYPHINAVSKVGKLFAEKFEKSNIDIVAGPALGGIILSQWTAYHLSKMGKINVLSVFTEKVSEPNQIFNQNQEFKRGYDSLVKDKNVLIVEDLTTTGGSIKKVIDAVRKAKAKSIVACVMVNRNPNLVNSKTLGVQFSQLGILRAEAFDPRMCPYCKQKRPINVIVGHGKEFLTHKKSS